MNRSLTAPILFVLVISGACSSDATKEQPSLANPQGAPGASTASTPAEAPRGATMPAPLPAASARIQSTNAELPLFSLPEPTAAPLPRERSAGELLLAEVDTWKRVPFRENGTTRKGIGNPQFVRAVYRATFDKNIPDSYEDQMRTGKLVAREGLDPGDLVFFEGQGFGPFRSRAVGIFLGDDQFAMAAKDRGVTIERITASKWDDLYKTARRMPSEQNTAAPAFEAGNFGSTSELLREVAKAWRGTLYRQGGTTFEGIGNDEFVRSIYEAIYDTELEGAPKQWATMGKSVKRDGLQAGDIILYEAVGVGRLVNQRHAGMYISDGEFVHSMKGSAVTISKLNDARWKNAYVAARRIDPDALERAAERRAGVVRPGGGRGGVEPGSGGEGAETGAANSVPRSTAASTPPRNLTEPERELRDATEPWKGTPYKLGGTTKSGVDCSAFVQAVYQDVYSIRLPRTAEEQARLGAKIDRRSLVAGDLVFFRTKGMGPFFQSRHVGLYLGNGEFAQASGRLGVNIARLDDYYWNKKYESARRLPKS